MCRKITDNTVKPHLNLIEIIEEELEDNPPDQSESEDPFNQSENEDPFDNLNLDLDLRDFAYVCRECMFPIIRANQILNFLIESNSEISYLKAVVVHESKIFTEHFYPDQTVDSLLEPWSTHIYCHHCRELISFQLGSATGQILNYTCNDNVGILNLEKLVNISMGEIRDAFLARSIQRSSH